MHGATLIVLVWVVDIMECTYLSQAYTMRVYIVNSVHYGRSTYTVVEAHTMIEAHTVIEAHTMVETHNCSGTHNGRGTHDNGTYIHNGRGT